MQNVKSWERNGLSSLLSTSKQVPKGIHRNQSSKVTRPTLHMKPATHPQSHLLSEIQPESGNLRELLQNGRDGAILENPTNCCGIWGYCWPSGWLSDTNYCSFSEVFTDKPEKTAVLIFEQTKRVWVDITVLIKIWWYLKYLMQTSSGSNANQYKNIWFTSKQKLDQQ